jgi:3-oxoacyl-[acyl-carrier protein] reductase
MSEVLMFNTLQGKVVVVTGASKGIGKGIAKVFAGYGAKVVVAARGEAGGKAAVEELKAAGGEAVFVPADVTKKADMEKMAAEAVKAFGGIDVLCANAGMFPDSKLEAMTEEAWDSIFAVNLKGMLFSIQACLPELKKSKAGRIVITSSITGPITGFPGWTHYGATKAGQLGFMRTAAIELARHKITINAVLPGNILTEGLKNLGEDYIKTMAASIPLKRLGAVEDIGNAAAFFATDQAAYITGQALVIDGGQILPETLEAIDA